MSDTAGAGSVLMRPRVDQLLEIVSKRHRRVTLLLLKRGAIETTDDVMLRGSSESDASEIRLTHDHLPRLEDAGYIDWDRNTGEIAKGPRFDEIEPLLELIENHADELPPGWP